MKQTKKLTRFQRIFLERNSGIKDFDGIRCVEETNSYLKVMLPTGEIKTYNK